MKKKTRLDCGDVYRKKKKENKDLIIKESEYISNNLTVRQSWKNGIENLSLL